MLYNDRATDRIKVRPNCYFCEAEGSSEPVPAEVDAATTMGSWTYMCGNHFVAFGHGLGRGVGQVLLCGDQHDGRLIEEHRLGDSDAA
jgi:hypothetical protein